MKRWLAPLWLIVNVLVYIWRFLLGGRKQLSANQKKKLQAKWSHVLSVQEPTKQIIEAEKVFTTAWKWRGVTGTFAQQWKQVGSGFRNEQAVWNAHKLRNRIVHESGAVADTKDAAFVTKEYGKVLNQMGVATRS